MSSWPISERICRVCQRKYMGLKSSRGCESCMLAKLEFNKRVYGGAWHFRQAKNPHGPRSPIGKIAWSKFLEQSDKRKGEIN